METVSTQTQELIEQVNLLKKGFTVDAYRMSIGELASMYKEGELVIPPILDGKFKWSIHQHSRLIESILIGIPIASIFVNQNDEQKWELIDGIQRLSTIFEFMGILKDNEGKLIPSSTLTKTDILPALDQMTWEKLVTNSLHFDFRRTQIEVKIIKQLTDNNAKLDMIERLNNSSMIALQEFRSQIFIMLNEKIAMWIQDLSESIDKETLLNLLKEKNKGQT